MRKKIVGSLLIIGILILCINCIVKKNKTPVANAIKKYVDVNAAEGEYINIKIRDFTNFNWDKVLIFNYPTTNKEIESVLGVPFSGPTDLATGMIFTYEGQIVKVEYFEYDYWDNLGFIIYASQKDVNRPNYAVFSYDDAVFEGYRFLRGKKVQYRFFAI